jgi:glycosyltransferase involved in cell wall biosynthesis
MIILNFIPEEKLGGMVLRAIRLAKILPHEFISIIATPGVSKELMERIVEEELPFVKIPIHRVRKSKSVKFWAKWVVSFLADIILSRKTLRDLEIEVLHMNGLLNFQMVLAALMCRIPVVWQLNDTLPYIPIAARRILGKAVAKIAAHVVCSSEAVAYYAFGNTWRRIERLTILGVPVESTRFQVVDPSVRMRLREKFGYGMYGEVVLGTVSVVNPIKNISLQMKVLHGLVERGIDAHLVVVGSVFSSQKKHFDNLVGIARSLSVEKRVFFTGYQEKVEDFLHSFDIFVFTSLSESGPMVILEAMLAGLPIVTSRVGLIPYIPTNLGVFSTEISATNEVTSFFVESVCKILSEGCRPAVKPRQDFVERTFDIRVVGKKLGNVYRGIRD